MNKKEHIEEAKAHINAGETRGNYEDQKVAALFSIAHSLIAILEALPKKQENNVDYPV